MLSFWESIAVGLRESNTANAEVSERQTQQNAVMDAYTRLQHATTDEDTLAQSRVFLALTSGHQQTHNSSHIWSALTQRTIDGAIRASAKLINPSATKDATHTAPQSQRGLQLCGTVHEAIETLGKESRQFRWLGAAHVTSERRQKSTVCTSVALARQPIDRAPLFTRPVSEAAPSVDPDVVSTVKPFLHDTSRLPDTSNRLGHSAALASADASAKAASLFNQRKLALPQRATSGSTVNSNSSAGSCVGFISAAQQLEIDVKQGKVPPALASSLQSKPSLGLRRQPFAAPFQGATSGAQPAPAGNQGGVSVDRVLTAAVAAAPQRQKDAAQKNDDCDNDPSQYPPSLLNPDGTLPDILKPLDPKLVTQITLEIMERQCNVDWSDIAGLQHAKSSVEEAIVWPLRRPDLFVGLRDPPRGLLLFGPPGTGKTMIARAIASRAQCTFLNISSSSLMSKWVGDGEKMVRCMFAVATVKQPSVIFIDEIDSLLSMRGEGEQDAVRRVKTEFLVQLDGVGTHSADRVLLIGATNRPEELDEAARRRMEKRLYIPLPDDAARRELVINLINKGDFIHMIEETGFAEIARLTEGYSGADLKSLCREAAMGPLRDAKGKLGDIAANDIRPVLLKDFVTAVKRIKPSVGAQELQRYVKWNDQFGSFPTEGDDDADAEPQ